MMAPDRRDCGSRKPCWENWEKQRTPNNFLAGSGRNAGQLGVITTYVEMLAKLCCLLLQSSDGRRMEEPSSTQAGKWRDEGRNELLLPSTNNGTVLRKFPSFKRDH